MDIRPDRSEILYPPRPTYQWMAAVKPIPERYRPYIIELRLEEFEPVPQVLWSRRTAILLNKKRHKTGEIWINSKDEVTYRRRMQDESGLWDFYPVSEREFRTYFLGLFAK